MGSAWIRVLGLGGALLVARPALAEMALPARPVETGIADAAGLLTGDDLRWLSGWRSGLERQSDSHLAVLVVPETGGEAPMALAERALETWGLGPRSAVLLVVLKPREVFLRTSPDLRKVLGERASAELLDRYVVPQLASYPAGALYRGLEAVSGRIEQAPAAAASPVARAARLLFTTIAFLGWGSLAFIVARWTFRRARAFALRRPCPRCGARVGCTEEVVIRPTERARGHGLRLYTCRACGGSLALPFEIAPLRGRGAPVGTAEVLVGHFGRAQRPDPGW